MKIVLRTALAYCWSILPLQSWMALLGAIILAFALVLGFLTRLPQNIGILAAVGTTGAVFVAFVPALAGGAALRYASSRSMLHLRPHGRVRMLAAATLAITALAALIALPVLLGKLTLLAKGFAANPDLLLPGEVFAVSWTAIAALWLVVFLTSGSRVLSFFVAFIPMFVLPPLLIRNAHGAYDGPGPYTWFALAVAAWVTFAIWYMQARSFRIPRWFGDRSSQTFENSPAGLTASLLDISRGAMTAPRASSQLLLGISSPFRYAVMTTVWLAVFIIGFALISPGGRRGPGVPGAELVLLFGAISGAQLAYMSTRRARMLWLRTGSDRASLFAMAERIGLAGTLWTLLLNVAVVSAFAYWRAPERLAPLLLLSASLIPAWIAAFYCGMSLTRGATLAEIALCSGVIVLFFVELVFIRPFGEPSLIALIIAAGVSLVVSLLLRLYARHRWMALDWRIARLPSMTARA